MAKLFLRKSFDVWQLVMSMCMGTVCGSPNLPRITVTNKVGKSRERILTKLRSGGWLKAYSYKKLGLTDILSSWDRMTGCLLVHSIAIINIRKQTHVAGSRTRFFTVF